MWWFVILNTLQIHSLKKCHSSFEFSEMWDSSSFSWHSSSFTECGIKTKDKTITVWECVHILQINN